MKFNSIILPFMTVQWFIIQSSPLSKCALAVFWVPFLMAENYTIMFTLLCPKPISGCVSRTTVKTQMTAITTPLDFSFPEWLGIFTSNEMFLWETSHTACISFWILKRKAISTDNGFLFNIWNHHCIGGFQLLEGDSQNFWLGYTSL